VAFLVNYYDEVVANLIFSKQTTKRRRLLH